MSTKNTLKEILIANIKNFFIFWLIQVKKILKKKRQLGQYEYWVNSNDNKKLLFLLCKCDNNTVAMF